MEPPTQTLSVVLLQPSLSDPLRRRDARHGRALHKKKERQRGSAPNASVPPHNLKAYQLYTLYRDKHGKIMQVRQSRAGWLL